MIKNVLVTGGAGFIGSTFIHYLLLRNSGITVYNIDALTYAGNLRNLDGLSDPHRYRFFELNICNRQKMYDFIRNNKIDTIVNFAAETHVDRSILEPGEFINTNVVGTQVLLDAARKYWIDEEAFPLELVRFHQVSTDEVYGSLKKYDRPWSENSSYKPNSPYAASKAAADQLVRAYGHTYGLPYSISIASNTYGPRQFPEKLIPLMILNASQNKPLPVYGDGKQIRDWLYVEDHCEAIWDILNFGRAGETYNVGGGNQIQNLTIVKRICDILDVPQSLITFVPDRLGHDYRYELSTNKIAWLLGWNPTTSLENGLEETVNWYINNPEWLARIQNNNVEFQSWIETNYNRNRV